MARPRVIVADTDESYVIPLQKKFAELFADKIDLEIITDKDYFNQLFSLSQHADIMLVSDTLYNSGLKKHDIRHLMILSEHYEPGQTDELDICRLFKYTRSEMLRFMRVCRGILAMFIGSYGMSYERKVSVIFRRLKRRLCRWVSHTACLHY